MSNSRSLIFRLLTLAAIALSVSLAGCRPRGVLSSSEMEDVLYDLHFTDGVVSVAGWRLGHDTLRYECYTFVLEKHGITQAQFDSSLVWYTAHPLLFDKIYPHVIDRLTESKTELDSLVKLTEMQLSKKSNSPKPSEEKVKQEIDSIIKQNLYGLKPVILRLK